MGCFVSPPGETGTGSDTSVVADSGDSSGSTWGGSLAAADVVISGESSSATGGAVYRAPDTDGDGSNGVWISAYFRSVNCRFESVFGAVTLTDAPLCIRASGTTEYIGYALATSGTVVAMGAIGGGHAGTYTGQVYLFDESLSPGEHDESAAFSVVYGESQGDYAGLALAFVGDTNGDGSDDLLVGAPSNDDHGAGAGKAYLFSTGLPGSGASLGAADTVIYGSSTVLAAKHGAPEAGDGVGTVLNGVGDVNGDGLADLAIGCNGADDLGTDAGLVSVFFGPVAAGEVALRDGNVIWNGDAASLYVGDFVDGAGDPNQDGYDDLAVSGEMGLNGRVWLLNGPGTSGTIADAVTSFVGQAVGDFAGASLALAGDVNGDQLPDLVVGAYGDDTVALDAGTTLIFLAPHATGSVDAGLADARFTGEAEGDGSGRQVESAGDYNGDGRADIVIGAPYNDGGGAFSGAAYIIFGQAD